jgi:phospholipase C
MPVLADKVEHVIVLMLENRSFDHMLGYLSLEGGRDDVDGLRPGMANDHGGRRYPIHHLAATYFPDERWDPDHSAAATDRQINDGAMDGFAASYAETLGPTSLNVAFSVPGGCAGINTISLTYRLYTKPAP